jgi:Ca2+-binding RTX toxin-like protein
LINGITFHITREDRFRENFVMANETISGGETRDWIVIGDGDQVVVRAGGLVTTEFDAITSKGYNNSITVSGSVISSANTAIILNNEDPLNNDSYVAIGSSGVVQGHTGGIKLRGPMDPLKEITNLGIIQSTLGSAIAGSGRLSITNDGSAGQKGFISGGDAGITFTNGEGKDNNLEVLNVKGTIKGAVGIQSSASDDRVLNGGTIEGTGGYAVRLGAGNDYYRGFSVTGGSEYGTAIGIIDMGEGDDTFEGGHKDEIIVAGEGNDTIDGSLGTDTLQFETNKNITVDLLITEAQNTGEGNDSIRNIDNLIGGSGHDTFLGSGAANTLVGGKGNDVLDGHGGADRLEGGEGDDIFHIENAADVLVEADGQGDDTARTVVNYTLGGGVHVEELQAAGNAAIDLTGNELRNILRGNAGINILKGRGWQRSAQWRRWRG